MTLKRDYLSTPNAVGLAISGFTTNLTGSKVLGIDVSKWQGKMNWEKAKNAGAKFAFIRAGSIDGYSGALYKDSEFERNAEIAPNYMIGVGFYFYVRPNYDTVRQADFFSSLIYNKTYNLRAVDDAETSGGLTPYYVEKRHYEFCERLNKNLNKNPSIYTTQGWWHGNIVSYPNKPTWASQLDLWVANWTWRPTPALPVTWSDYVFWQYSGDGNGKGAQFGAESASIDLNWYNGDMESFLKYIGSTEPPPVDPPPDPEPTTGKTIMVVTSDALNRRSGPSTNFPVVGQYVKGDKIEVHDVAGSSAWVKDEEGTWSAAQYGSSKYMTPE